MEIISNVSKRGVRLLAIMSTEVSRNETAVLRFSIVNTYQMVAPFTQTASPSHLADPPILKGIMTGGRKIRRVIVQTELRACWEG